jgi:hypothetical protein
MCRAMVTAREPPIVPVMEPKFAPLLGHPAEETDCEVVQEPIPTGRVSGIVVDLPVPFVMGFWSRFVKADC